MSIDIEQKEATGTENFLEKNLEQIAKYNKPLADKIASHEITTASYRLDVTKCDDLNLYIDGHPVHDEIDALGQAQSIFQKSYKKGHLNVIYGFGLGYLFTRFLKEVQEKVIVYEPNIDILRITLGIFDFSEALANPKVKIVHDKFNIKPAIESMSVKDDKITLYFLPYHGHFFKKEIDEFVKDLSMINSLIEVGFKELARKSKDWALSTAKNLIPITKGEELDALKDKFKDKPAVVVSAGPSLLKSIETIKKYRDKIVVISVGIALKALLKHGIKPDFTAIIETGNCLMNVEGADVSGINFIFPPEVNSRIYEFEYDRTFNYYTENLFTSDWVMDYTKIDCRQYMNRGTVSITALWSAKILGCNPIILTGQDLAYSGGKCYAGDSFFGLTCTVNQETGEFEFQTPEFENQKKEVIEKYYGTNDPEQMQQILDGYIAQKKLELAKVKGQNGELLPTSAGYALFVKHFEELIPELYEKKLFNCSTGGAQIDGYENAIMEDVLKEYANEIIDVEKIVQQAIKEYEKPADTVHKKTFLDENIAILKEYMRLCEKGSDYLKKFKQQLKRTRILRNEIKNIFFKAMDTYAFIIKNIYSKNKYLMSLSYQDYLGVEDAIQAYNKSQNDDNFINMSDVLNMFFVNAIKSSEESVKILNSVKEAINESVDSES